jgi:hypothetical protein
VPIGEFQHGVAGGLGFARAIYENFETLAERARNQHGGDRDFSPRTEALFENHVDVALAAADEYEAELWDDQHILPDWKVYDLTGIDNDSVSYDDYDFPDTYCAEIDGKAVQGKHIGQVLGDKYVQNVEAGIEHTSVHRKLTQLLTDYCLSDVADLMDLYTALGGSDLDDTYRRAATDIV